MPSLMSKKKEPTYPVQVYAGRVPCSFVVQVPMNCSIEDFFGYVWKQYGPALAAVRIDATRNDPNPDDETWCMTPDGRILKDGDTQLLKTYIPLGTGYPKLTLHSRRDLFDEGKQVAQANRKRVAWMGIQPINPTKSTSSLSTPGADTSSTHSTSSSASNRPASLLKKGIPLEPASITVKLPASDTISHRRDLVPLSVAATANSSANSDLVVVVSYSKRNSRIGRGEWEINLGEIGPCDPLDLRLAIQRTGAFMVWTDMDMEGTEREIFDAVVGAIGSAWAVIIAFSEQYARSERGKRELYSAIASRTKYIPIALGDKPYTPTPTSLATFFNITSIIDCTEKLTAPSSLREVAKQLQVLQAAEHWAPDLESKLMQFMRGDTPLPKPADRGAKFWRDGDAIEVAVKLPYSTNEEHAAGGYVWVRATIVSTAEAFGANRRYRVAFQPEGLPKDAAAPADWVTAGHVRPVQASSPPWMLGIIQPGRAVEVRKLWAADRYTWWAGRFVGVWDGWYRIAFDASIGGEFFVDPRQVRVAGTWDGLGADWKPTVPTGATAPPSESAKQAESYVLSRCPSQVFFDQGLIFVSFDYEDSDILRDEADDKKHLVDPVEVVKVLEMAGWRVQPMPRRKVAKDSTVSVMDLTSPYAWHLQDMNDAIAMITCVSSSYFSTPYARVEFNIVGQAMGVPIIPLILTGSWWEAARENEIRVNADRVIDCTWTFDFDDRMKQLVGVIGNLEKERLGGDGRRASVWSQDMGKEEMVKSVVQDAQRMSFSSVLSDDDDVPLGQRGSFKIPNGYFNDDKNRQAAAPPTPPPKGSSMNGINGVNAPRNEADTTSQQQQNAPEPIPSVTQTPPSPTLEPQPSPFRNPYGPKFAPPRPSPLRNAVSRPPSIDSDVSRASFTSERDDITHESLNRHRRGSSGAFKNTFRRPSSSMGSPTATAFAPTPLKSSVTEEDDGEYAIVAEFADRPAVGAPSVPVQPQQPQMSAQVQPQIQARGQSAVPQPSTPMTPVLAKEKEKEKESAGQRMSSFFGLKKKKSLGKEGKEKERGLENLPPSGSVTPDVTPTPPVRKAFAGGIDKSMISGPVGLPSGEGVEIVDRAPVSANGVRRSTDLPRIPQNVSAPAPVEPVPVVEPFRGRRSVDEAGGRSSYDAREAFPTPAATPVRPARSRSRTPSPARHNSRSQSPRRATSPTRHNSEEEQMAAATVVPLARSNSRSSHRATSPTRYGNEDDEIPLGRSDAWSQRRAASPTRHNSEEEPIPLARNNSRSRRTASPAPHNNEEESIPLARNNSRSRRTASPAPQYNEEESIPLSRSNSRTQSSRRAPSPAPHSNEEEPIPLVRSNSRSQPSWRAASPTRHVSEDDEVPLARSNSWSRSSRRAASPTRHGSEEDHLASMVVSPAPRVASPEPTDRPITPPSTPRSSSPSPRASLEFVQTGPPPRRPSKSGARKRTATPPPNNSPSSPPSPPRPSSSYPNPTPAQPAPQPTPDSPTARGGGPVRTVLKSFISDHVEYGDEVDLHVGDTIVVRTIFADGWCEGVNVTSGKHGMFPAESVGIVADKAARESMLVPRI
ncbi:hypothetical protein HDV00_002641 [Rhizophlyctis rosea]|nr:hypothetical protein HDV00_002641 [Rhizophlyctis rosea]